MPNSSPTNDPKASNPERISSPIDEQLALLAAARAWLCARTTAPWDAVTEASPVRTEWLAESGVFVIELFDAGQIRRLFLSAWSQGCRWLLETQGQLQVMPIHADPGLPLLECGADWAEPWRETIPSDVRHTLFSFERGRWALLYWASHYPAALDLLRSEPKLLWLLLMTGERDGWSEDTIARFLRLKRRFILERCGLQPSEAALNLLGKCHLGPYGEESLGNLRSLLADAGYIRALRHIESLYPITLQFCLWFPTLMQARWLKDVPDEASVFLEFNHLFADTHELGNRLDLVNVQEQVLRCRTFEELRRLHNRWLDERVQEEIRALNTTPCQTRPRNLAGWLWWSFRRVLNGIEQKVKEWPRWFIQYPAPPIRGSAAIRPITTYRGLLAEGQSQRHCVAIYHERVLANRYYVYQVLEPERCTLGLALFSGQPPRLDQLKGERNREVSDETRHAVQSWLYLDRQPAVSEQPEAEPIPNPAAFVPLHHALQAPTIRLINLPDGNDWGETDLAILIVSPDHGNDIQQALQVVMQEGFQATSLRLAVIPDAFAFEGPEKQHLAHRASALIEPRVDALIRIDSHQVAEGLSDEWSPVAAKARVQETLTQVVRSITETITRPGLIGVDFTDIRAIFEHRGKAVAAVGVSTGSEPLRAMRAAEQAHRSLATRCRFNNTPAVLACITGGMDLSVNEFDEVGSVLRENLPEEAMVVLSTVIEPDLPPGQIQVCIIAAGVGTDAMESEHA
jgi:hypothetical protein